MPRRFHLFAVTLVVLLSIADSISTSTQPFVAPAQAQVVTPDPSPPSFANQRFVIGSDNISNPAEGNPPTFATAELADPNAFPTTTVQVHNYEGFATDQRFWLSVRIRQQDAGVEVTPQDGYAQMGLIAPGGDAIYTVTFPETTSARVEFEVNGSTDAAIMLTMLQFALEAGFTTADIAGVGDHDAEIGRDLADVVAKQYLADLPSLVPCANAVAAVQRGLTDQDQFTQDLQGCLESPMWQASVDQVLTRAAKHEWFQQTLNLAGKALPELGVALKGIKASQFATQVWGMYQKFHPEIPGAMVGTAAFLSVDTRPKGVLGAATAVPDLSVYEVAGRAQEAILAAGTYRYQQRAVQGDQTSLTEADVNLAQGAVLRSVGGSAVLERYYVGDQFYMNSDGDWTNAPMDSPYEDPIVAHIRQLLDPALNWHLVGQESVEGEQAFKFEQESPPPYEGFEAPNVNERSIWISSETFLPIKLFEELETMAGPSEVETIYSDFGAPIDIQAPPQALAPTPTPDSTPPPVDPATLAPYSLFQFLLTSPFPLSEMPPGYTLAEVTETSPDDWAAGAIGEVLVATEDDQFIPGDEIRYTVFATAEDAASALTTLQAVLERQGYVSGYPVRTFDYRAIELTTSTAIPNIGTRAIAGVAVQVGNVLVVGGSVTLPENPDQARVNAADLAAAGIQHLSALLGSSAATRAAVIGGLQITLQAAPQPGQQLDVETLNGARDVIARRLSELGVEYAIVQVQGSDTIVVQLPPSPDLQGMDNMLQATGLLEIIDTQGEYLPPGTMVSTTLGGIAETPIYPTVVSSADLKDAHLTTGNTGTNQVIGFELQEDAGAKFFDFTSAHLGEPMSILIDKQVISSPRINGAISTRGIIEGVAPQDLNYVLAELRSGPLPVPFDVAVVQTIERVSVPVDEEDFSP